MPQKRGFISDARKKPYTIIENWLFDLALTVTEKMVYIYLCSWVNSNTIAPAHSIIAAKTSLSVASVKRALDGLKRRKLIRVITRLGDTSVYIICDPTTTEVDLRKVAHGELPPEGSSQGATVSSHRAKGSSPGATPTYKNKKQNKKTTTTGVVVVSEGLKELVSKSGWARRLTDNDLCGFVENHGGDAVFHTVDVLIETYKKNGKTVRDPVALVSRGLREGITAPEGYAPFPEREKRAEKLKHATGKKRQEEEATRAAEEERYRKLEAVFESLPEPKREAYIEAAKKQLPPVLRGINRAIYAKAYELMKGDGIHNG